MVTEKETAKTVLKANLEHMDSSVRKMVMADCQRMLQNWAGRLGNWGNLCCQLVVEILPGDSNPDDSMFLTQKAIADKYRGALERQMELDAEMTSAARMSLPTNGYLDRKGTAKACKKPASFQAYRRPLSSPGGPVGRRL
ncbi:MAG: hypothetical protein A2W31_17410 [Planctomycetes bacterium RBG_16_64_10]|nr:MAG: hypothetical protein A2W31_17410 [Planctomycetes bacterium RBG_16_64_10]